MLTKIKWVAAAALLAAARMAGADVVTITAQKDAMIFGTHAGVDTGNASGMGPAMFTGADGSSNRKRSLVQFDIASALPAGAVVTGATLSLYVAQIAGSGGGGSGPNYPQRTYGLFDLQKDWTEGPSGAGVANVGGSGQGYARSTGDVTWNYTSYNAADPTANTWTTPGGDFAATASATTTVTAPYALNVAYTWSSPTLTADAQTWLDSPATNHGWMIRALNGLDANGNTVALEDSATSFLGFWTKDGAANSNTPQYTPALTLTYTVAPEPTSGLLLLAVPTFLLRRRATLKEIR